MAQTNTFPSSGNAGLGTTTPPTIGNYGVLALNGNSTSQGGYLSLMTSGSEVGSIVANSQFGFQTASGRVTQFYTGGNPTLQISTAGNVGIGTITPSTALQIGNFNGGSSNNQLLIPGVYNFEQIKLGQIGNGNSALEFVNHNSSTNSYGVKLQVDVDQIPGLQFQYATSTTSYASLNYVTGLYMNLSGNVGIGTTNPGTYRLAVNGGIHSQSVNVDLTGWSDYVFKQGYILPSLAEVKTYIDKNHHLPEVPSEQEVIKDGINVGEIVKLQTKKIEELTLYAIQQQEENEKLKAENKTLKECQQKINQAQQAQINELKRQVTKILTKS